MPSKDYRIWINDTTYSVVDLVMIRGRLLSFVVRLMWIEMNKTHNVKNTKSKFVPLPKIDPNSPRLTGKKLLQWLKDQGAEPIDAATKKRLIASGNWGMPDE